MNHKTQVYKVAGYAVSSLIIILFLLKIYEPLIHVSLFGLACFFAYKRYVQNTDSLDKKTFWFKGIALLIILLMFLYYNIAIFS